MILLAISEPIAKDPSAQRRPAGTVAAVITTGRRSSTRVPRVQTVAR
jgi:hypothetical protein